MSTPRIGFISLGCPKALVDSERILNTLRAEGYVISPSYEAADVVVVNTCGFIDSAVDESLESIGEAIDKNGKVIVTGCLGTREAEIRRRHPQVLKVTGAHAFDEVIRAVHEVCSPPHRPFFDLLPPQGVKLTPPHYAYLKISEGCNHRCSFCIIPSMRGDLVSQPIDEVLIEAQGLVDAGVKELLVISQDTSAYGSDLHYAPRRWQGKTIHSRFYDLVDALGDLNVWVRLHYVYPYPHVDDIIPLMAKGRVLPYLDIPFQHATPRILKAMKRPAASENTLKRIEQWRKQCPELALRSTFIVGFPGETDEDFEELLDFLTQAQLDRVGAFMYSPVSGAQANALPYPVDETLKQERLARFMAHQAAISAQKLKQRIGQTDTVLIDEVVEEGAVARTRFDAPDIDGQVFIDGANHLQAGQWVRVRFDDADEHDLWASLV